MSKIVVITGANSGIGKATTIELAKQGGTIVMVCRNEARGEAARQEVIKASANANVFLELCDLTAHESIRACSQNIRNKYSHIDILINNAGGIFGEHQLTVDGLEQTFGLNHMGYFLFTHYMLDLVKKGTQKRIVNVASLAHKMAPAIPWGDLQLNNVKYRQFPAYALSKLYNIYFTQFLAKKLANEETGITVNCLHPGTVYTGFGATGSKFFAKLVKIGGPLLATPENGAKTSVYLATSPDVAKVTGVYYAHRKKARITKQAKNFENARRIWSKSMELAGLDVYGVVED
ncbi:SDR family oxidoreductase [Aureispira anguillae]|uniref:SDR family oxidoreductase n=1 Tax=Aureispira anguillae TaxID=2864201 RepID=A0A915YE70_9BACT|nr:SDR family oxidoreductase [Aureispira anguillae]BDS11371.1 SDR family oxidoreductase [Aureispira anguillae]